MVATEPLSVGNNLQSLWTWFEFLTSDDIFILGAGWGGKCIFIITFKFLDPLQPVKRTKGYSGSVLNLGTDTPHLYNIVIHCVQYVCQEEMLPRPFYYLRFFTPYLLLLQSLKASELFSYQFNSFAGARFL